MLIIGAGLSGIGAAAHLAKDLPGTSYAVLERRDASGGTWDLFRYPGVRSDSDMHTLGYRFRPWRGDTRARRRPVDPRLRPRHRARVRRRRAHPLRPPRRRRRLGLADARAGRSTAEVDGETREITADFLWACSGYYDYDEGYTPHFEGQERFRGQVVHPQHWPEDLDHAGKRVVVIGSGATAVTLVPALAAGGAGHVTMLQRSPTYVLSVPGNDSVKARLTRLLGEERAYSVTRWKNIAVQSALYRVSRRASRAWCGRSSARPTSPSCRPATPSTPTSTRPTTRGTSGCAWCRTATCSAAIKDGSASVVTDQIATFTETGVELASGEHLDADVVVTATGLNLQVFGGTELVVDGEPVEPHETMAYRAMMLSGVPNFAFTIGYTNASWTLKADLVAEYVVRVLKHLRATGTAQRSCRCATTRSPRCR